MVGLSKSIEEIENKLNLFLVEAVKNLIQSI